MKNQFRPSRFFSVRRGSGAIGRSAQRFSICQGSACADAGAPADLDSWAEPDGLAPALAGAPEATLRRAAAMRAAPEALGIPRASRLAGGGGSGSEVFGEVLRGFFLVLFQNKKNFTENFTEKSGEHFT